MQAIYDWSFVRELEWDHLYNRPTMIAQINDQLRTINYSFHGTSGTNADVVVVLYQNHFYVGLNPKDTSDLSARINAHRV